MKKNYLSPSVETVTINFEIAAGIPVKSGKADGSPAMSRPFVDVFDDDDDAWDEEGDINGNYWENK